MLFLLLSKVNIRLYNWKVLYKCKVSLLFYENACQSQMNSWLSLYLVYCVRNSGCYQGTFHRKHKDINDLFTLSQRLLSLDFCICFAVNSDSIYFKCNLHTTFFFLGKHLWYKRRNTCTWGPFLSEQQASVTSVKTKMPLPKWLNKIYFVTWNPWHFHQACVDCLKTLRTGRL